MGRRDSGGRLIWRRVGKLAAHAEWFCADHIASRYDRPVQLPDAMKLLRDWTARLHHEFWSDDVSILDTDMMDHGRQLTPRQITDVYLLALAVKLGGRLGDARSWRPDRGGARR